MQMAQPSPAALEESGSSLVSFFNTWSRFGIELFNFSPLQSMADGNPAPTKRFCFVEGRGLGDNLSKMLIPVCAAEISQVYKALAGSGVHWQTW